MQSRNPMLTLMDAARDLFVRLAMLAGLVCLLLAVVVFGANGLDLASLAETPDDDESSKRETSISSLIFSPDGQQLLSVEIPGLLVARDAATLGELGRLRRPADVITSAACSPVGPQIAVGTGRGHLLILPALDATPLVISDAHPMNDIWNLEFSPDGRMIASGAVDGLRLWQADTGDRGLPLESAELSVSCLQFSADGRQLLAGGDDGTVRVWDTATGLLTSIIPCHERKVTSAGFSADGSRICSAGLDGTISVWDLSARTRVWQREPHAKFALAITFSPDAALVASGGVSDPRIQLWDAETGERLAEFDAHDRCVSALAFSADGHTLYSGGWDGMICRWDVPTAHGEQ